MCVRAGKGVTILLKEELMSCVVERRGISLVLICVNLRAEGKKWVFSSAHGSGS